MLVLKSKIYYYDQDQNEDSSDQREHFSGVKPRTPLKSVQKRNYLSWEENLENHKSKIYDQDQNEDSSDQRELSPGLSLSHCWKVSKRETICHGRKI